MGKSAERLVVKVPASKQKVAENKKEYQVAELEATLAMLQKVAAQVAQESKAEEARLRKEIARLKQA